MCKIRALRADEIECRVASVSEKGCQLLLYKDARCDKRILDEVYGSLNWQDKYEMIDGVLYCSVGIYDDAKKQWVWKQDCGKESIVDKEKGQASDAFKRACFNWGIGRELYTRIFIWVKAETEKSNNKWQLKNKYVSFIVADIQTDNEKEKITGLKIADNKGNIVYTYGKENTPKNKKSADRNSKETFLINAYGPNLKEILAKKGYKSLDELNDRVLDDFYNFAIGAKEQCKK